MFVVVASDVLIHRVVMLAELIWREHYPAIIGEEQVEYMLEKFQRIEAIRDQIDMGMEYYLVTRDGEDAGYFAVQVEDGDLFLSKLYIKSSESGRGLGGAALNFIQDCWKPGKVRLTVNKENSESIRFYESRGFIKTGEVVQEIGGGFVMDDYKMERICWGEIVT